MKVKPRQVVGWALVGLLALFIILNFGKVEVNFLFAQIWLPKALLIFGSASMGAGAVLALQFIQDLRKEKDKPPSA